MEPVRDCLPRHVDRRRFPVATAALLSLRLARRSPARSQSRAEMAGGPRTPTDVIPNKFVEANGAAREVLEKGFRFTPRNLGIFAVFGIAVPVIIYQGCVNEFRYTDKKYGRPEKKFM